MTITRTWLNEHMPSGSALFALAEQLAGTDMVEGQMQWLVDLAEADRFPHPPWKDDENEPHRHEFAYGLQIDFGYKPTSNYLTAEEWCLGTTCWYVRIECGWREYIAAEDLPTAIARGVIFAHCAKVTRDEGPRVRRRDVADAVVEVMAVARDHTEEDEAEARAAATRGGIARHGLQGWVG